MTTSQTPWKTLEDFRNDWTPGHDKPSLALALAYALYGFALPSDTGTPVPVADWARDAAPAVRAEAAEILAIWLVYGLPPLDEEELGELPDEPTHGDFLAMRAQQEEDAIDFANAILDLVIIDDAADRRTPGPLDAEAATAAAEAELELPDPLDAEPVTAAAEAELELAEHADRCRAALALLERER